MPVILQPIFLAIAFKASARLPVSLKLVMPCCVNLPVVMKVAIECSPYTKGESLRWHFIQFWPNIIRVVGGGWRVAGTQHPPPATRHPLLTHGAVGAVSTSRQNDGTASQAD